MVVRVDLSMALKEHIEVHKASQMPQRLQKKLKHASFKYMEPMLINRCCFIVELRNKCLGNLYKEI